MTPDPKVTDQAEATCRAQKPPPATGHTHQQKPENVMGSASVGSELRQNGARLSPRRCLLPAALPRPDEARSRGMLTPTASKPGLPSWPQLPKAPELSPTRPTGSSAGCGQVTRAEVEERRSTSQELPQHA